MGDFDANPFADPFEDGSVTQATSEAEKPNLDNFNPFGNNAGSSTTEASQPAVMHPSDPPPPYAAHGTALKDNVSPPPVAAPPPAPTVLGHEELLRRQEELERKAEELQRREQQMASSSYNPRQNNWPPFPKWFPVGPCFYQDFGVDIPNEFQTTVKMLYYLWMFYILIVLNNMIVCLAIFCVDSSNGVLFGMSILWLLLFTPCSLCWYRPVYKAFRSDSSFNFFLFFFMMFFQFCFSIMMAVGIPGAGWAGWIVALGLFSANVGVGVYACIQATFFSVMAALSLILLKKVHSIYRSTGASFEKAQQEFATGVMKNPGVQTAAATAATSAAQSTLSGRY